MIEIELPIEKIINNYNFNEELVKKKYNNDYKKLALDLAKENQRLGIEKLVLHSIIKEVREAVKIGISEDNYDGCVYDIKNILDKEKE